MMMKMKMTVASETSEECKIQYLYIYKLSSRAMLILKQYYDTPIVVEELCSFVGWKVFTLIVS